MPVFPIRRRALTRCEMKKSIGALMALVLVVLAGGLRAEELKIELTPDRVARGEYLLTAVVECTGCHTERQRYSYGYPPKPGMAFAGGRIFANLGEFAVSPNITPYGLSDRSDQALFDELTEGIRPDGGKLNPEMPYWRFRAFDREELFAIIAYLRSLHAIAGGPYPFQTTIRVEHPALELGSLKRPARDASEVDRGAYLVGLADCNGCHVGGPNTAFAERPFAGGREFVIPGVGIIRPANLTPDAGTGIGTWTREAFVSRFKAMKDSGQIEVPDHTANTAMPWWLFGNMTEADLGAIYQYLRTVAPVSNTITRYQTLPGTARVQTNWSERPGT
jgi:hypothetical protein